MKQNIALIGLLVIGIGAIVVIIWQVNEVATGPPSPYDIPDMRYDCLVPTGGGYVKTDGFPMPTSPKHLEPPRRPIRPNEVPPDMAGEYFAKFNPKPTFRAQQKIEGYTFQVGVFAADNGMARMATEAALRRIEDIMKNLTASEANGELARVNREAVDHPVKVSDDLWHLLMRAKDVSLYSGRAYDPALGPLRMLWRNAWQTQKAPDRLERNALKGLMTLHFVDIDEGKKTVHFQKRGMMLDFTGALRGFALDQAAWELKRQGIKQAFLRSGNVYHFVLPPDKTPFDVGIPNPGNRGVTMRLAFKPDRPGCATAGAMLNCVMLEHDMVTPVLDGRTGDPAIAAQVATVVGPDAMTCEMLSHVMCAIGPDKAYRFISKFNPQEAPPDEEESEE